jgi:hypothetical protein
MSPRNAKKRDQKIRPSEKVIPIKVKVVRSPIKPSRTVPSLPAPEKKPQPVRLGSKSGPRKATSSSGNKKAMWFCVGLSMVIILFIGILGLRQTFNREGSYGDVWGKIKNTFTSFYGEASDRLSRIKGEFNNVNSTEIEIQELEEKVFPEFTNQTNQ